MTQDQIILVCIGALLCPEITLGGILLHLGHTTSGSMILVYGIICTINRLAKSSRRK